MVNFCSTQKCINRDKIYFAANSVDHYKTAYIVNMSCGAITNSSTLQMYHMWSNFQSSTWQIAPHYKQFCHVVPNCLSCEAKLLHMKYFAPQTLSTASATIIMYVLLTSRVTFETLSKCLNFSCFRRALCQLKAHHLFRPLNENQSSPKSKSEIFRVPPMVPAHRLGVRMVLPGVQLRWALCVLLLYIL